MTSPEIENDIQPNEWTIYDDLVLRDFVNKQLATQDIATLIGRSVEGVLTRCVELGLKPVDQATDED